MYFVIYLYFVLGKDLDIGVFLDGNIYNVYCKYVSFFIY